MEPVDRYLSLVTRMTSVSFCKEEAGYYLLKRPSATPSQPAISTQISYETMLDTLEVDPFANLWMIASVKKREGNLYADRVSIGRATNCDIVLRVPFISKVQAHILCNPQGVHSLRAHSTASPTLVNGRKLDASSTSTLAVGDLISFGSMAFEFVGAQRLYEILNREALRRNSVRA
jgi:hypothetical protein